MPGLVQKGGARQKQRNPQSGMCTMCVIQKHFLKNVDGCSETKMIEGANHFVDDDIRIQTKHPVVRGKYRKATGGRRGKDLQFKEYWSERVACASGAT